MPSERKLRAEFLVEEKQVKVQRACRIVNLSRSQWYYETKRDDTEVINSLERLALDLPTRGFDSYYGRLRAQGHKWNRKRVLRIYRKLNLSLRRKRKRRLPARIKQPLVQPVMINRTWSMDFMHDSLEYGRKIRVLNIIDDFSREALAVDAAYSHSGESLVAVLDELIWSRGKPLAIRTDNGPEFISKCFTTWCKERNIENRYIQPGQPTQNAYIERFNRLFREDVLDAYVFEDLKQVKRLAEEWKTDYNLNHPHSSLGGISPVKYLKKLNLKMST
jgi:putative transposase